jgi:hypothetical protein
MTATRHSRIIELFALTAEIIGTTLSAPTLKLFVADLADLLPDEAIERALVRCRRDLSSKNGFAPKLTLKDALDRAAFSPDAVEDAEPRVARDQRVTYADKRIVSDFWGNYGPKVCYGQKSEAPKLPQPVEDIVRRIGGWRAIKTMTSRHFPRAKRPFYEEYKAWAATAIATD